MQRTEIPEIPLTPTFSVQEHHAPADVSAQILGGGLIEELPGIVDPRCDEAQAARRIRTHTTSGAPTTMLPMAVVTLPSPTRSKLELLFVAPKKFGE